jgi:molybdate transport repressor ModE-like protein
MDMDWDDVRLFLAVAETGSFSAAARQQKVGQPTVSRRIVRLEESVSEPLFVRGVGGATLTDAGHRLVPAARRMAESAGELARQVASGEGDLEGLVRVAAPPGVAYEFLAPFSLHAAKVLPGLRLEVSSSIGFVDLTRGDADLALRTRRPDARGLVCLAEMETPHAAYAGSEYAASLPAGYRLEDLDWITWAPPYDELPPRPQLERLIDGFVPVFTSDSYLVQRRACVAGIGAMVLSKVANPYERRPQLVQLDLDMGPPLRSLYLVAASSALAAPRVRAMADLLSEGMQGA